MNNNAEKEKWVEAVLGSAQGLRRAKPSANLYQGIATKLAGSTPWKKTLSISLKKWAAAAVLLLALNIGTVAYFASQHRAPATSNNGDAMINAMQLESTYNY